MWRFACRIIHHKTWSYNIQGLQMWVETLNVHQKGANLRPRKQFIIARLYVRQPQMCSSRMRVVQIIELESLNISLLVLFFSGAAAEHGSGPPHSWGSEITQNDTLYSVGLLWMRDRPVVETSDNSQLSQETDIQATCGIRTCNSSKRAAADPRIRLLGHCSVINCMTFVVM